MVKKISFLLFGFFLIVFLANGQSGPGGDPPPGGGGGQSDGGEGIGEPPPSGGGGQSGGGDGIGERPPSGGSSLPPPPGSHPKNDMPKDCVDYCVSGDGTIFYQGIASIKILSGQATAYLADSGVKVDDFLNKIGVYYKKSDESFDLITNRYQTDGYAPQLYIKSNENYISLSIRGQNSRNQNNWQLYREDNSGITFASILLSRAPQFNVLLEETAENGLSYLTNIYRNMISIVCDGGYTRDGLLPLSASYREKNNLLNISVQSNTRSDKGKTYGELCLEDNECAICVERLKTVNENGSVVVNNIIKPDEQKPVILENNNKTDNKEGLAQLAIRKVAERFPLLTEAFKKYLLPKKPSSRLVRRIITLDGAAVVDGKNISVIGFSLGADGPIVAKIESNNLEKLRASNAGYVTDGHNWIVFLNYQGKKIAIEIPDFNQYSLVGNDDLSKVIELIINFSFPLTNKQLLERKESIKIRGVTNLRAISEKNRSRPSVKNKTLSIGQPNLFMRLDENGLTLLPKKCSVDFKTVIFNC